MKVTLTIGQLKRLVKEAAFKDAPELPLDLAVTDVTHQIVSKGRDYFTPVTVSRGRKFRGNGYIVGSERVSNGGFAGNGARPLAYYTSNKVWDPGRGCIDSFNGNIGDPGVEEWKVSDDERFEDLTGYVKSLVNQCVKKCGSDYRYRMFWLRKVLGISTEMAEELANATKELDEPEEFEVSDEDQGNQADKELEELKKRADDKLARMTVAEYAKAKGIDADALFSLLQSKRSILQPPISDTTKLKVGYLDTYASMLNESIDWIPTHRREDGRHEFLVNFNNTKLDPHDIMYKDRTRMWARDEREVERNLRNWHPEYEITKVVRVNESVSEDDASRHDQPYLLPYALMCRDKYGSKDWELARDSRMRTIEGLTLSEVRRKSGRVLKNKDSFYEYAIFDRNAGKMVMSFR